MTAYARGRLVGRVLRTCDRKTIRVPRRWCRAAAFAVRAKFHRLIGQLVLGAWPHLGPQARPVAWCRRLVASVGDRLVTVWHRRRQDLARDRPAAGPIHALQ